MREGADELRRRARECLVEARSVTDPAERRLLLDNMLELWSKAELIDKALRREAAPKAAPDYGSE